MTPSPITGVKTSMRSCQRGGTFRLASVYDTIPALPKRQVSVEIGPAMLKDVELTLDTRRDRVPVNSCFRSCARH